MAKTFTSLTDKEDIEMCVRRFLLTKELFVSLVSVLSYYSLMKLIGTSLFSILFLNSSCLDFEHSEAMQNIIAIAFLLLSFFLRRLIDEPRSQDK